MIDRATQYTNIIAPPAAAPAKAASLLALPKNPTLAMAKRAASKLQTRAIAQPLKRKNFST